MFFSYAYHVKFSYILNSITSLAAKLPKSATRTTALEDSPTTLSWGEGPLADILVDAHGPATISCVTSVIQAQSCEGDGRPTISRLSLRFVREMDALALAELQATTMRGAGTKHSCHLPHTFTLCDHPSYQVSTSSPDPNHP